MKEIRDYKPFGECISKIPKQKQVKSKDYKVSGKFPIVSQEKELISGYWDDETFLYHHDKPVIIFGDHTKEVKYIDFDFVVGADGTQILLPKENINAKFFYYALKATRLRSLGYARHFKLLKEISFYIPSSKEQQAIVSRLDAAFAEIDKLKANAAKQLNEARALFQAALTECMEPKEGWEEKILKDIVLNITDGDHQPPPKAIQGIPFITISNINKTNLEIDFKSTFFVPEDYYLNLQENRKPIRGDVLYTVTGSFGIPVLVKTEKEFCFQRHIALIRPNNEVLNSLYLFYWCLSSYATKQAEDTATGVAQRTVSLKALRHFVISLPPLATQQSIVAHLDALSAKVKQLETNYEQTLSECDALKQAMLREIFE